MFKFATTVALLALIATPAIAWDSAHDLGRLRTFVVPPSRDGFVNLRTAPMGAIIFPMPTGTQMKTDNCIRPPNFSDDWCHVYVGRYQGWADADYLQEIGWQPPSYAYAPSLPPPPVAIPVPVPVPVPVAPASAPVINNNNVVVPPVIINNAAPAVAAAPPPVALPAPPPVALPYAVQDPDAVADDIERQVQVFCWKFPGHPRCLNPK